MPEFKKGDKVKWFFPDSGLCNYGVIVAVRETSCSVKCDDGERYVVAKNLLNFD